MPLRLYWIRPQIYSAKRHSSAKKPTTLRARRAGIGAFSERSSGATRGRRALPVTRADFVQPVRTTDRVRISTNHIYILISYIVVLSCSVISASHSAPISLNPLPRDPMDSAPALFQYHGQFPQTRKPQSPALPLSFGHGSPAKPFLSHNYAKHRGYLPTAQLWLTTPAGCRGGMV
jgi:hypothetical protein